MFGEVGTLCFWRARLLCEASALFVLSETSWHVIDINWLGIILNGILLYQIMNPQTEASCLSPLLNTTWGLNTFSQGCVHEYVDLWKQNTMIIEGKALNPLLHSFAPTRRGMHETKSAGWE